MIQDVATAGTMAEGVEEMAEEAVELNVIDLAMQGGWIMLVLLLMSIYAIYVFVERNVALRRALKQDDNFMSKIKDYIHSGNIDSAIALCNATDNPVARMVEKGISRMGRPLNDINTAVENVGNIEVGRLENGLAGLASVSGGAPMIGFLGTVTGMIQAFFEMANAGNNIEVSTLAGGIYTALVTTVGGLFVGIIAYFAYNYLVARVDKVVRILEARTMEFMDLLNDPAN
ncbi:MAG: MotA/TolQ/ExbB proton channel family protein [Bacteroidales bacterium]|jgi:biopolymer transport protein ExbB|nr:MotA/TolQ/ExbB proton channel family protein [Bacteroidales bacterium]